MVDGAARPPQPRGMDRGGIWVIGAALPLLAISAGGLWWQHAARERHTERAVELQRAQERERIAASEDRVCRLQIEALERASGIEEALPHAQGSLEDARASYEATGAPELRLAVARAEHDLHALEGDVRRARSELEVQRIECETVASDLALARDQVRVARQALGADE